MKVILADKLYVKKDDLRSLPRGVRDSIFRIFKKVIMDISLCEVYTRGLKCRAVQSAVENGERAYSVCRKCPKSKEEIKCYSVSTKYVKFSAYHKDNVELLISILSRYDKVEIVDKRILPVIEQYNIKWDALSKDKSKDQKELAKIWLKDKVGLLVCPPRFGKTILSCIVTSRLHTRILVLAHQKELLDQFKNDYLFASTLTDKDIAINPNVSDMEKYKVVLCTYQQFLGKYGNDRLKDAKKLFGCIVVDEVHHVGASSYSKIVDSFWSKYRLGITATPSRRDQKEFRVYNIFGEVCSAGGSEALDCKFRVMNTEIQHPVYQQMRNREWNLLRSWFVKQKDRNDLIIKWIVKDVEKNRKIFIPVIRSQHITDLVKKLVDVFKEKGYNVNIASFHGKLPPKVRVEVVEGIKKGKFDVVVAMESMIKEGLTAKPMDCIYFNVGNYQFDEHKMYQLYSRIRTPMKGKKVPIIRVIQDIGSISEKSVEKCRLEFKKRGFSEILIKDSKGRVKRDLTW